MCLRYLTDKQRSAVFTLDPSGRAPLRLEVVGPDQYRMTFDWYNRMDMRPDILFWSDMRPDIWTAFCLTMDTAKNVAQVFRGPNISVRKILPSQVRTEKLFGIL